MELDYPGDGCCIIRKGEKEKQIEPEQPAGKVDGVRIYMTTWLPEQTATQKLLTGMLLETLGET